MSDAMYLNAFDKFVDDPNISMNPLNVVASYSKDATLPLAIFYRDHGYKTFVLLDDTTESRHISSRLIRSGFAPAPDHILQTKRQKLESIEDYIIPEDYMHAVNQTYEVKLRDEGYAAISADKVANGGGIVESLKSIWVDHDADDWGEFNNGEIARYICNKIAIGQASFLSENTRDNFRTAVSDHSREHKTVPGTDVAAV